MKHVVGLLVCAVLAIAAPSYAQGVTTASITGLVKDASGGDWDADWFGGGPTLWKSLGKP